MRDLTRSDCLVCLCGGEDLIMAMAVDASEELGWMRSSAVSGNPVQTSIKSSILLGYSHLVFRVWATVVHF